MADGILSQIGAGFGRGLLALGTGGISELGRARQQERADTAKLNLQNIGGILSGGLPVQQQQQQLAQLGTPGALQALQALQQRQAGVSAAQAARVPTPLETSKFDLNVKKFDESKRKTATAETLAGKEFDLTVKETESDIKAKGLPDPQKQFDNAQKLRKEFISLSDDFTKQRDSFSRIQASAEDPSGAGDLALIFSFMKVLDPTSVVRESEFATAETAGGVPPRVWNLYNKVLTGQRLPPKQRKDFVTRANKLFSRAQNQHSKRVSTFRGLAERAGLSPQDVVIDVTQAAAAGVPETTAPIETMSIEELQRIKAGQ